MTKYIVLLLFFPVISFALEIKDTISHFDQTKSSEESNLVLLSSGKVLKISSGKNQDMTLLMKARQEKRLVQFNFSGNRMIKSFKVLFPLIEKEDEDHGISVFEPTILGSTDEAGTIFRNLRRDSTSWSQCFNRAHIWAYESKLQYDLDSMKVFLFFTSKYIRRFDYEWWFHVSPYTLAREKEEVKERILDLRFSSSPLLMKAWTDLFMINKASCPTVEKYSQYRQHQDKEDCYLIKKSMYYLQPLDLDNHERNGIQKTNWNSYEVRRAYRDGFGKW